MCPAAKISIQITNWGKFQHYKDRNPPWIKLYRDVIEDPENFRRWRNTSPAACKFLIELWLLASKTLAGCLHYSIEDLEDHLRRNSEISKLLKELEFNGWIETDASTVLAGRYHDAIPETETETETEKRESTSCSLGHPPPADDRFDEFWTLYPRKVKRKTAETAWKNMTKKKREAALAALPAHILHWDDPKFIPHAATWLRAERWEDDLSSSKSATDHERRLLSLSKRYGVSIGAIEQFQKTRGRTPVSRQEIEEMENAT